MTIPANLVDKTRRWDFQSSVRERGFQVDTATIEYASIDLATYNATADAINSASPTDEFPIIVTVDSGVPVELFRGRVLDWRLEERFTQKGRETVGILEAQDSRSLLLNTRAPNTIQFLGTVIGPAGIAVPGQTAAQAIQYLAGLVGIFIEIDTVVSPLTDYNLYQPPVTAGMSIGAAIAALLDPVQGDRRGLRVDFVRRGGSYRLQQRTIPVGAAEYTVDAAATTLRSYRRTFPLNPEDPPGGVLQGIAFDPTGGGGTLTGIPRERLYSIVDCYSLPFGTGLGEVCRYYTFGRLSREVVTRTLIAPDGTTALVVDESFFEYDTNAVLVTRRNDTRRNHVLEKRQIIHHIVNDDGKEQVEFIEYFTRESDGTFRRTEVRTNTKAETEAGVSKMLAVERIGRSHITIVDRDFEWSPGDMQARPEFNAPLTNRLREIPVPSTAQQGLSLYEIEVAGPLDTRIVAGNRVALGTEIVTPRPYYVTSVRAHWQKDRGHGMSITGEAWI